MKFSHSLVLAFIATALAQTGTIEGDVAAIPACAKKCLDDAILGAGCASTSDFPCQCGSAKGKITAVAGPCVAKACPPADLSKVLALTTEICALANAGGGAGGSESSASGGGSDTAVPSSTGGGAGGSETTGAPTTTGGGSEPTATTAINTSEGGSETTGAPTGTGGSSESVTETGGTSETGTPTGGAGGGETTSGAPTSTPTSGAMATAAVWNYGIVAAGAGVVAAGFM